MVRRRVSSPKKAMAKRNMKKHYKTMTVKQLKEVIDELNNSYDMETGQYDRDYKVKKTGNKEELINRIIEAVMDYQSRNGML